jgi:hypothetical protein
MEVIQKVENGFSYIICGRDSHKLPKVFQKGQWKCISCIPASMMNSATVVVYLKALP